MRTLATTGRYLIVGLLAALLLAGCGLGAPRLEGSITDAVSGAPVPQAEITVGDQTAVTDDEGAFRLDLELGSHEAAIRAEGYIAQDDSFSLTADAKQRALDLALEPRMVQGHVSAQNTPELLSGISVTMGDESTLSDANGAYELVARQITDLIVSGASVMTATIPAADILAAFDPDGHLSAPLDVSVEPRTLAGTIREPDGTPVSGAEVRVGQSFTRTNAEGRYALRFTPLGESITVTSGTHRESEPIKYEGQSDYSPVLDPYIAQVMVAEEGGSVALQGATVAANDATSVLTDATGLAEVRAAPGAELQVTAYGYLTATVTYDGGSDPLAVALTPTLLQGTITEEGTGNPIAKALVQVFREGVEGPELVHTDEIGRYSIPDASQVVRLYIKAPGYDRADVPVQHLGTIDVTLAPFAAQGIYIPFGLLSLPDRVFALLDFVAESPSLNAVVIDVKGDWAHIAWPSTMPVAQEVGAFEEGPMDMNEVIAAAHERGIYTIARIVTFKDRVLAEGKPEWAVHTVSGALYYDGENLPWSDPFRTEVWDYNIGIALEAVAKGFDEVQFDYLRFPSEGRVSDRVYSQEATFESRTAAMAGFCAAVHAAIEPTPAFVSADIFGLTVWVDSSRDMGIGQRLDDIAANMDYISPMLYPQTFNPATLQSIGISDVELYPYETLYYSIQKTLSRTDTKVRPWLQHYSGRYTYGVDELLRQRKGAEDGGATGWLFWNAKGSYLDELFGADPYSQMAVIPQPPEDDEGE